MKELKITTIDGIAVVFNFENDKVLNENDLIDGVTIVELAKQNNIKIKHITNNKGRQIRYIEYNNKKYRIGSSADIKLNTIIKHHRDKTLRETFYNNTKIRDIKEIKYCSGNTKYFKWYVGFGGSVYDHRNNDSNFISSMTFEVKITRKGNRKASKTIEIHLKILKNLDYMLDDCKTINPDIPEYIKSEVEKYTSYYEMRL